MKYLNKSFNVYASSQFEPQCQICLRKGRTYIATQDGYFCMECYNDKKHEKETESQISKIIKKVKDTPL